jgi:very-short-patch-repair endonuclease
MDLGALHRLAQAQTGLFTWAQARACGFSADQIRRRLDRGAWRRVSRKVLCVAGTPESPSWRDIAALLAVPGGVLGGPAAARKWGMPVADPLPYVVVPANRHRRLPGVVLLRGDVPPDDVVMLDGVLVTTRARTVFDCARVLPDDQAMALLDHALRRRWLSFEDLTIRVRDFVGRPGAPKLVRLVARLSAGEASHAERLLTQLLRAARIRGWTANADIIDDDGLAGVGDVVFPEAQVVIEVDGFAYHSTRDDFERDRRRQNRLVVAGWTVLRFTWRDLTERPEYVVNTVRVTLAKRGMPLSGRWSTASAKRSDQRAGR